MDQTVNSLRQSQGKHELNYVRMFRGSIITLLILNISYNSRKRVVETGNEFCEYINFENDMKHPSDIYRSNFLNSPPFCLSRK